MPIPEELKPYATQLGYPNSERLGKLLSLLFDTEEKTKIAVAMPGTVSEIAEKAGLPMNRTESLIKELHRSGAVNLRMHETKSYRLYPGMIELRDAAVLSEDVTEEMIRLWDEMIHNDLPETVPQLEKMGVPPMMRVIPIEESVESESTVLDADSARHILKTADQIVAIPCVCRKTTRKLGRSSDCPAPENLNLCLLINGFGQEAMSRKVGELLTTDEAIQRLEKAEEAGLVHLTRNNIKKDMIMCNCCACCCTGLFMLNNVGYNSFAPSRFRVKIDEEECVGCGTCEERCQFLAIEMDDVARIDLDKCFGCGVCVPSCPSEALTLEEIRSKDHIRVT